MIRTILTAALFATLAVPAYAADRPVLKSEALVTGGVVRVGDLIDNAGIIANVAIFRAPDLGATGIVPADAVAEAVRAHALVGLDTNGISEVVVTRASREIPVADVEAAVARALSTRFNLGEPKEITVNFERDPRAIQVEPNAKGEPKVARIVYDPRSGKFDAALEIPTGATGFSTLRLAGKAAVTADVVTLSHNVDRGVLIRESDINVERKPRAEIGRDVISSRDQVIGFAARSNLRSGNPLRAADLMKPELVQRNETVTLIYEVPGITLTVRGKAIEGGADGDVIAVLNEQSKRTVQGVIVGPGRVVISTGTPRLAANLPVKN
ncbi:flagellar basal body P-ring formation chaperone FlgA [Pararhizobium sp.]|uniref:flagellar basal body P-ring formation chaperone FlgA n=1 Tax=Pararhizobium sp. TaxID=1977563 RepID=UPI00271C1D9F|nr:flagellar basal body P-ring formation chaperone FlgA [Pararhizobium sp.]MDO9418232.1 flagellar basal body P-ring formation chaperone FlgA [Pararhizobium sp.]